MTTSVLRLEGAHSLVLGIETPVIGVSRVGVVIVTWCRSSTLRLHGPNVPLTSKVSAPFFPRQGQQYTETMLGLPHSPTLPVAKRAPHWSMLGICIALASCAADSLPTGPGSSSFRTLSTTNLTTSQEGDIPILITVPHGGDQTPADVDERMISYSGLVKSRELYLRDIAVGVATRLENVHGITPYVVIGESHRKYIDYNRDDTIAVTGGPPENEAYEDTDAETYYDEYHDQIDAFVSDIDSTYGGGLLIDLHGTTSVSDKILRGTRNGDAIWGLLSGYTVSSIPASEEYAGQTAVMAHDGDLGTQWKSFGTSEWIEFDLGSSVSIGSVEIAIPDGATRTYDFEIEVWNGSSWVVAYDGTNTQGTSDFEIYEFSSPITGSKVRVSCHGSSYSNANYIKEIRIQELGWDPIVGPNSVWGELADAGYSLEPTNSEYGTGAETTLIGGFTVDHHGSENGGLDAFQMEIGLDYRDTQAERDDLIVDLADAIDTYHDNY